MADYKDRWHNIALDFSHANLENPIPIQLVTITQKVTQHEI